MNKSVSLGEFVTTLKRDARDFQKWWECEVVSGMVIDEATRTSTKDIADWFKQFCMFFEDRNTTR